MQFIADYTSIRRIALLMLLILVGGCFPWGRRTPLSSDPQSARQVFEIRQATEKYRDIERAAAEGYFRASGYIPNMGYQFANPKFFSGFDLRRPPILLYNEKDGIWDLTGVVYTVPFDENPKEHLPFKDAEYQKNRRTCRYQDGTGLFSKTSEACPKENPLTRSPLRFWHPDLWVMTAWVWYPNPNGLFSLFNSLINAPR